MRSDSHEVPFPSAYSDRPSHDQHRVCLTRIRYGPRVSHPLAALLLADPCGPISCRTRSWDFPSELTPSQRSQIPLGIDTSLVVSQHQVLFHRGVARNHLSTISPRLIEKYFVRPRLQRFTPLCEVWIPVNPVNFSTECQDPWPSWVFTLSRASLYRRLPCLHRRLPSWH